MSHSQNNTKNKNATKRSTQFKKGGDRKDHPSVSKAAYKGGQTPPEQELYTVTICTGATVSTTSAGNNIGTYNNVFKDTDVVSLQDFKDAAALYQTFRVLEIGWYFYPSVMGGVRSNNVTYNSPCFVAPSHGDITAFAAAADVAAMQHNKVRVHCLDQPIVGVVKMSTMSEADFQVVTGTTTANMCLKTLFYCATTGASDVVTHGVGYTKYTVQFRNRVQTSTTLTKSTNSSSAKDSGPCYDVRVVAPIPPSPLKYPSSDKKDEKEEFVLVPKSSLKK